MYSESDLDAAVDAGVIRSEDAAALRDFVAASRQSPVVDEEHFRLLTGFNDIFVSIAALLVLGATAWIAGTAGGAFCGAAVAAVAWGLAEYFTRQRRMALPSILLLVAFVGGVFGCVAAALLGTSDGHGHLGWFEQAGANSTATALKIALAALIAAGSAWLHWRRFHVPITVAAGTAAAVGVVLSLLLSIVTPGAAVIRLVTFAAGLAVFSLAMWWDMSDPGRTTRRTDVAFWLHLLAAPLIVHPAFSLFAHGGDTAVVSAAIILLLYVALAAVALAIDRRALMVSALTYVLVAVWRLFNQSDALSPAVTGLLIGSALLLLSAFWHAARARILVLLPPTLRDHLPPLNRPAPTPRPAS
ncbi:MAG: hypothetical protein JOY99_02040 [Sphingomonadaceae bacterium]|nr:hypothetical protein [Sphingomonadaceae bacterium]